MTSEPDNPAVELSRIIAEGRISEEALQAITGIPPEKLQSLNGAGAKAGMMAFISEPPSLSNDEIRRLSILAAQLTEGMRIGDDERLTAIFESLTIECRLTLANIALLTGLDVVDVESALRDPRTVPIDKKYELAIKGSYLIGAVNRARGQ
ncbi:HTH domain-containing protein [Leifsonia sp. NPDC058230]|uniref:HTH domain-containing protein n=1 Tax=Leifsonia sp. NPDC058230 TaxID=3346391 RepID=UPI0036DDC188